MPQSQTPRVLLLVRVRRLVDSQLRLGYPDQVELPSKCTFCNANGDLACGRFGFVARRLKRRTCTNFKKLTERDRSIELVHDRCACRTVATHQNIIAAAQERELHRGLGQRQQHFMTNTARQRRGRCSQFGNRWNFNINWLPSKSLATSVPSSRRNLALRFTTAGGSEFRSSGYNGHRG